MDTCDVGIVLVNNPVHDWTNIVPKLLIYDNKKMFEVGVRRIIDRQLAFKRLHMCIKDFIFTPAAIILDNVSLADLDYKKIGVPSIKELHALLNDIWVIVDYASPEKYKDRILFPLAWDWSRETIGYKDMRMLSEHTRHAVSI